MQRLARPVGRSAPRRAAPPGQAEYQTGLALADQGQWKAAADAFARAVDCCAGDSVYWLNLAHARVRCGEFEGGAQAARRGACLAPESELALCVAAECLYLANRHRDTIALFEGRDLDRMKDHKPHFQLGLALHSLDRYQEASQCYLAALARKADYMPAHVQLGNAFQRLEMHEEARECFKTAAAIGGSPVDMASGMAYEALHACRWDQLEADAAELMRLIDCADGSPQPFQLLALPSTRRQQMSAAQRYAQRCFGQIQPLPQPVRGASRRRIRLGYLSCDFHAHATTYLLSQLFEFHDRDRFEVVAYSYGIDDGSAAGRRIRQAADRFVDAREMADQALAEAIRADGIDVLFDLKGYTLGARNGVLAFRPSPVQVNYLGYPGTLGAPFYDYIVGDRIVTPLEHAPDYSEKIAQMPACYQPNDRSRLIGSRPERVDCELPEQGFVFCSFNNPYKITAEVFDIWCRLLRSVEHSVLWLYESNAQAHRNLVVQAQQRGVAAERLVWASTTGQAAHLARLQLADLVLDTAPVCAHTTASDALWAGVPLITCPGETFVSRVAASILQAAQLPELIAPDFQQYESAALTLAREPGRLDALRQRVARCRHQCALFDSARYARDFESLISQMHDRHLRGLPPDHLPAPDA
jgi:predicted O-linked N-acetylglucosamine transferase (SPINDLY family)